jgi:hypothetical protein
LSSWDVQNYIGETIHVYKTNTARWETTLGSVTNYKEKIDSNQSTYPRDERRKEESHLKFHFKKSFTPPEQLVLVLPYYPPSCDTLILWKILLTYNH